MLALNDIHLGVHRNGGTTPASREGLRSYLFGSVERILVETDETHVVVFGDLFDQFEINPRDWIETYRIFSDWLQKDSQHVLTLVAGNHDWSPKGDRVSSFQMLCHVLSEQFDTFQVVNIDNWACVDPENNVLALAHCSNQDIFNMKIDEIISKVEAAGNTASHGSHLVFHANFDNNFAVESDHSLNVSREQAQKLIDAGFTLYFAHEHQGRLEMRDKVLVFGNQWPSSISDCLNNDIKLAHVFRDGSLVDQIVTWRRDDELTEGSMAAGIRGFGEVDWRNLGDVDPLGAQFVRVIGTASTNEAGECLSMISKFRTKSSAFVITNSVKIDGVAANEDLPETFEATKAFDVMEFIMSNLDDEQQTAVKKLAQGVAR